MPLTILHSWRLFLRKPKALYLLSLNTKIKGATYVTLYDFCVFGSVLQFINNPYQTLGVGNPNIFLKSLSIFHNEH